MSRHTETEEMADMTRTRMTASERGEQVLTAAIGAFAESGYAATRTDEIARRAGVSQPYVIRLFGGKRQLFLAALQRVCDRIEEIFRSAAAAAVPDAAPAERLAAMGEAFHTFLAERELGLVLLHGFAASSDPEIGTATRDRYGRMYYLVRDLTGASVAETRRFMATGMLLIDMAAMGAITGDGFGTEWAAEIVTDLAEHKD
ncbi:TetR/AcrR family transcriptional regulator [Nocardia otitidiscaviarum]|uniref:TetR/AcrR family transcriptional regulator n=1 Tax=Nocardia otitidiscaviarum TaxID=1823 RepID=UPI0004A6CD7E|nr:TetR/AcrR family transcriptional regulator [Nocardia otitidiscaviarum]